MAQPTSEGDRDFPMLLLLVFGLCAGSIASGLNRQRAVLEQRILAWSEAPLTVAGVQAARFRGPARTASSDSLARCALVSIMIRGANRARPYARAFLLLCLGIGAYPALARRFGPARHWPRAGLMIAAIVLAVAGLGLGVSVPAAWPRVAVVPALGLSAADLVAAAVLAVLALAAPSSRGRKLQHGPAFKSPAGDGEGILVGAANPGILPGHARWIAAAAGSIELPFSRLSCGVTILGEKGSGKSRLLFAIHDAIRARYPQVPILIHDPKGEWYRTYYDPKADLYFAPHFKGSAVWSLWRDFKAVPELRHQLIAATVHAHPVQNGSFWMDQAVDLLDASIDPESFLATALRLSEYPRRHADDKFALSVFGTARLGFLDLAKVEAMATALARSKKPKARSIDDFLNLPGRIFLLNDPSCSPQQQGSFSLFLSAFLLRVLSMPDVPAGTLRAVAIVDEALTFNLPPDVERRVYALCRSKGLCVITGAQRLPDSHRDERGEWDTAEYIFALKVVNQHSQQALSRRAGSLVFKETATSTSKGAGGRTHTRSEHTERFDAIPPEQFGRLAPREFILFHDQGLVTGKTADVTRSQRPMTLPKFDAREDVRQLSATLLGNPREAQCELSPSAEAKSNTTRSATSEARSSPPSEPSTPG